MQNLLEKWMQEGYEIIFGFLSGWLTWFLLRMHCFNEGQ